jgi:cytochrome c oxidase cbb3-type subunit 3
VRILITATILFPVILAAQHGQVAGEAAAPRDPAAIAAGAKLYATSCGGCHGPDGSGARGPNLFHRLESHSMKDDELFGVIRNGVAGTDMPPTTLSDDDTWKLTAFLRALTGPASEAIIPGDAAAGEKIFWDQKAGCSECHAILGRGNKMGPDLSNIGGSRPIGLIREALIPVKNDPSHNYALGGKEGVTVTMKSGVAIKGIARNRSNYSLQVVDTKGDLHLIRMTDVKELKILDHSLMPDDYATRLSSDEFRDLLAYLAQQSVRAPERAQ